MKDYEGRKVDFDKMNNARKRKLYKSMWGEVDGFSIEKTGDSASQDNTDEKYKPASSYRLRGIGEPDKILINQFQIGDENQFLKKYKMAIAGDGQEESRITTLHSSSLCALLHFYNVTEDNPLTMAINGREIKFTDSIFEFKSPVIDPRYPSNMDVVLIGKNEKSYENVVLFLESKFAEYYLSAGTTCRGISKNYLDNEYTQALYKNNIDALELKIEDSKKDPAKFDLVTKDPNEPFYIAGIKQMISHYCGIRNLLASEKYTEKDAYRNEKVQEKVESEIEKEKSVVMLGEIVFDSKIGELKLSSGKTCLEIYREKYQELAKIIAAIENLPKNFEIVKDLLCYSTIRDKIEDKVKAFYYGK
ncbi:hypothetical protein [uncultured Anaerovibrio sp.]|uniref:hypothetical protein n=1 Tax=uncultured Anaerovibrio sp. TaxID=361586 RepID=UPI0025E4B06E|nr:hypothetical protein [uncultured Anaerovibrio sp.]